MMFNSFLQFIGLRPSNLEIAISHLKETSRLTKPSLKIIEEAMLADGFDPPQRGERNNTAFHKLASYITHLRNNSK